MLEDLKIINGVMYPKFDKYNNVYTVNVENDIHNLSIDYEFISKDDSIEVVGNDNLKPGENIIYINVLGENKGKYIIYVNKKEELKTSNLVPSQDVIEIKKEIPSFVGPLIGVICFVLIILSYFLIFNPYCKIRHNK